MAAPVRFVFDACDGLFNEASFVRIVKIENVLFQRLGDRRQNANL